jgi:8-oxo-dGTP pyrophosphatase MutT (NUDIX family)
MDNESGRPTPLPEDGLPVVERSVVRLVVLDSQDKVLLFHTRDAVNPGLGAWWELPGGGIEAEETYREAAVRELREEAGINTPHSRVGPPSWRRRSSFRYRQERRLYREVIAAVRLPGPGPGIDESRRLDYEKEDYFGYRWWPIAEICVSRERFYPGRLPALLRAFLDGQDIDEPFELWS